MTGKVVDHKETGIRYAVSEHNFNENVHEFVRDLLPTESVRSFQPKARGSFNKSEELPVTPDPKDVPNTTPHNDDPTSGKSKTK